MGGEEVTVKQQNEQGNRKKETENRTEKSVPAGSLNRGTSGHRKKGTRQKGEVDNKGKSIAVERATTQENGNNKGGVSNKPRGSGGYGGEMDHC